MAAEDVKQFEPLKTLESGPFKAFQMDYLAKLNADGHNPEHDGCIASWIIQAPWAHPLWHSYWLHFVHLRPIDRGDGPLETKIYLEGATHELWLYALDPEWKAEDVAREIEPLTHVLIPVNFCAQLKLESDDAARELAERTAADVLNMRLNPDTDWRRHWIERFGGNMVK